MYWMASRGLLGPTTCLVPSLEFGYSLALVMRIRIGVGSLGVSGYPGASTFDETNVCFDLVCTAHPHAPLS